jgi:ABC-type multidrug transport system fused ATPase/permease subunit
MVIGALLILIFVFTIKNLFFIFLVWFQEKFTFNVHIRLSQYLFRLYLFQPYTFHLQRNSSELIRNINGEVGMFSAFGVSPAIMLISEILILLGICTLLLLIQPIGLIIAGSIMGFTGWLFLRTTHKKNTELGEKRQHHSGLIIQHLQQGLGAIKDVKLLGRESEFIKKFKEHNFENARAGRLQKVLQQLPRLWLEVLVIISLSALIFSMLTQGRALDDILPVAGLFAVAAFRLMPSISRILNAIQSLRYGLTVVDTLSNEVNLSYPDRIFYKQNNFSFNNSIEFKNVTYSYPGSQKSSLIDISLKILKGESIGVIGASGAGKTTLVDILLGLLLANEGEVMVDGYNIQNQLRQWQNQIGYVPQSIYLTDDTLRRNVAFGISNDEINEDAVLDAVCAAQIDEFIKSLPLGLDTVVGENGIRLSGGQRQRIGIARALYHKPNILVLDEATSALDTETEQEVMQAVRVLKGKKTIVIVAHRMSTIEDCDRLYQLNDGRLIQEDIPKKILSSK